MLKHNNPPLELDERENLLLFADSVIQKTRKLVLDLWKNKDFSVNLKHDNSPVTDVDLKAEELAREMIRKEYPSHGIIGEEYENSNPGSEFQWTIDPIDGTENLVSHIPTFGTLIGLQFQGQPIIGLIDHPAMNIYSRGGLGLGVYCNNKKCTIKDAPIHNSIIATSNLATFQREGLDELFFQILRSHSNTRIYYDCYSHTLALCGSITATIEVNINPWDLTPIEALITEAGGQYDSLSSLTKNRTHGLFGNPSAVNKILKVVQSFSNNVTTI